MSDISYEEDFEDMRTPLLKLMVLILYLLPIPLTLFGVFDLLRLLRPGISDTALWIVLS